MRNDLNQLTNLKSLSFTWKIIANLVGVFPQVVLCHRDFRDFFDTHISSVVRFVVDRVEKLKLFVSVVNPEHMLLVSLFDALRYNKIRAEVTYVCPLCINT